ncbi:MAG TPA: family 20 glycosylhydrolase [Rhodanobacteraceae bacterium]|nr:family 20 glycosylhydrolase [Rhodanobacteraceae bacterium]
MPFRILSILTLAASLLLPQWAQAEAALSLIPLPAHVARHDGAFTLASNTRVVVAKDDTAAHQAAEFLIQSLAAVNGPSLKLSPAASAAPAIHFALDATASATAESYQLDITPTAVDVRARSAAGLIHGAATLFQLLTRGPQVSRLPALHIDDAPRFAWRGLMLDSVRHMQPIADIRRLIDQMALHKLNVLHWHLTDDQGWRIEIKRYPELTRVGSWRTPPDAGQQGEPARYGGFYTQQEIRTLVAYAAARGITIVPEMDMPGHAQAAVAAYPALGVTGQRPAVSVDWGVNPWLYNVDDATFTFIDNVLDEVMALFPSRYIHVGGDEAIKDQWQASPAVQEKMQTLGISDENALQGWFIGRIGQYLEKHGRRLIGWDEILEGENVPHDATVMSWRGTDGAIKAALLGHDVVMSPAPTLYFDHVQGAGTDEYAGRLGVESLKNIYDFTPVPGVLNAAQAKHVLGLQANIWTEHIPTVAHVEHAAFPRLAALAELGWSPAASHNWKGFLPRLAVQMARYRAAHVNVADSAFAVAVDVDRNLALATGRATVTLANQADFGAIHYTLDGSAPTLASPRYAAPFTLKLPATVRAASFDVAGQALAAARERVLDRAHLLSYPGNSLPNCPGNDFRLRLQPTPDAASTQPVYAVNVFDMCQLIPPTRLDGVQSLHLDVARLVRNYALAHEQKLVVARPHQTPAGELVVVADRCDGKELARMPLPDPAQAKAAFTLDARLPAMVGEHALCVYVAAPIDGPLYGLGTVSLREQPAAARSP